MKIKNSILFLPIFFFYSCKENKKANLHTFQIEKNVIPDSISRKFNAYNVNNNIIATQSLRIGLQSYPSSDRNYICKALLLNDTLNVWINNYNGSFSNGILIHIYNENFKIKSVNPNVIRGIKFENFESIQQELILNKSNYKKGDSIFGKLDFECIVDSVKYKKMYGFFKTKIE